MAQIAIRLPGDESGHVLTFDNDDIANAAWHDNRDTGQTLTLTFSPDKRAIWKEVSNG